MAEASFRNLAWRRLSYFMLVGASLVGLIHVVGAFVLMLQGKSPADSSVSALGGFLLIVVAVLLFIIVQVLLKIESGVSRLNVNSLDSHEILRRVEPRIETIKMNAEISDPVRSIINREKEREAVRNAIREEMYGGDWEAAHYLIDEMERRFGYMQEAQQLRAELAQVREMTIEEKIGKAIKQIEKLISEHRWNRAGTETERMLKLFPKHERVSNLPSQINAARAQHKQELIAKWNDAIKRDAIDEGIQLLTELDPYVTASEAEALRESARHVFKEHLLNLGVQFSLAVTEQRWRDALEIGLRIRQEFPNSRMAGEVGEKLEILRVRAGIVHDADVVQKGA